ncbi:MAG: GntR family transcriptional regulator [Actinomycetota bacterium]
MASVEVPKYVSISNDLRARIAAAEFGPGERLPAQHSLAEEYGVTLMTLRHALSQLESDGLVRASKGRGTFVTEPAQVRYDLDHLRSFSQEMRDQGIHVETSLVGVGFDPDPVDDTAARAALDVDAAAIVELVRRRSIATEPVVLQRSFLTAALWSKIAGEDFSSVSLYDALATSCGLTVDSASETIRSVGLSTADAAILELEPGLPVLESRRTSRTADGTPFLHDRAMMRGDVTEIRTERSTSGLQLAYRTL